MQFIQVISRHGKSFFKLYFKYMRYGGPFFIQAKIQRGNKLSQFYQVNAFHHSHTCLLCFKIMFHRNARQS